MRVSILMLLAVLGASQVPSLAAGSDDAPSSRSTQVAAATETGLDANGHLQRVGARTDGAFGYTRLQAGVQIQVGGITKNVLFHGPDIVRVNANHGRNHWTAPSLVVVDVPPKVSFDLAEDARTLTLTSDRLVVNVSKTNGALTFLDRDGHVYTREHATAPQSISDTDVVGAGPSYEVENVFSLAPDEALYGFGYTSDASINRRGTQVDLVQTNTGILIPVMVSTRRYGVLWDTYSAMRFKDDARGATMWAESAPGGVDYYFMGSDSLDGVVAAYRRLTGPAPMYPKQAFGLFMSKERYPTQARLVEVAETFRRERFPLDYIVQDWQYWGSDKDGTWSGMIWDPVRFPDPDAMIRRIHDLDLKLMVSIWPSVGNDTALARELDRHGLRFEPLHWISGRARIYDAYSPLGRQIYFDHARRGLLDRGVDALWMDGTEVEVTTAAWDAADNVRDIKSLGRNALGDFSRYLNPYSLVTTLGAYEAQRAASDKRVFTLSRSAWAGAQRTAAASWSGDIFASWKTLAEQVSGGVSVTATGNPYWTQDIGGFFVTEFPGGPDNPAYRELFTRWFQFGAFNPIMRVHGTSIEREPYLFKTIDPPMYQALLDAVHLRYRLLPYIYSTSWQVTSAGATLMRPVPFDFPDDTRTHDIRDAFLFGPSLLVRPVVHAMVHKQAQPGDTIPASALRTPDGAPGLAGQYFEGTDFDVAKGRVVDATLNHTWPEPPLAEFPPGLSSLDGFSARWEGELVAPEDGEYEIGLEGDDGFRLYVAGERRVDDWNSGPRRYKGTQVALRQGQRVPVRIEYFQGAADRALRLAWKTPRQREAEREAAKQVGLTVQTYLPAGSDWFDFWTGELLRGGQVVAREAPLDLIPLYVRAGSIVPMGPVMQYATERPDAPMEIRIYPGRDARFTVYEDDDETYAYERGESARYELAWDDAARTLSLGERQGRFPGMVERRELRIVLVEPGKAGGLQESPPDRVVTYDGRAGSVRF